VREHDDERCEQGVVRVSVGGRDEDCERTGR